MRGWLTLVLLAIALSTHALPGQAQSAAAGFDAVSPSVFRIWVFDAKGTAIASGTGFVVASDAQHSSIVTAAHVLKGAADIRVDVRPGSSQKATVVGKEDANDVALLEIKAGNLPAVSFAFRQLDVGDTVAAAGYYRSQESGSSQQARLLYPGTISAMMRDERVLAFDNLNIQEGLSGGPMFDASTGAVLGMVVNRSDDGRIGGYAESAPLVLIGFLRAQGVRVAVDHGSAPVRPPPLVAPAVADSPDPVNPAILRVLPGAGNVVVVYDTSRATGANTPAYIAAAAADFATKFGLAFHVRATTAQAQMANAADVGRTARANNAIIAVTYGCEFHLVSGTVTKWDFGLSTAMTDSYGYIWNRSGKKEKTVNTARDVQTAIVSSLADLNDQVVAELLKQYSGVDDSAVTNLFRYALPIPNGGKKVFISLIPAPKGATAFVSPFGAAAQAGLQNGDLVLAVNGTPTLGKSQAELTNMLLDAAAGGYDLTIEAPDGTQPHITFEAKDLRWYVEHRKQPAS